MKILRHIKTEKIKLRVESQAPDFIPSLAYRLTSCQFVLKYDLFGLHQNNEAWQSQPRLALVIVELRLPAVKLECD